MDRAYDLGPCYTSDIPLNDHTGEALSFWGALGIPCILVQMVFLSRRVMVVVGVAVLELPFELMILHTWQDLFAVNCETGESAVWVIVLFLLFVMMHLYYGSAYLPACIVLCAKK